jgi:hypothetical protein
MLKRRTAAPPCLGAESAVRRLPNGLEGLVETRASSRLPIVELISPPRVLHCAFRRATEETVVGERNVGDARLD